VNLLQDIFEPVGAIAL